MRERETTTIIIIIKITIKKKTNKIICLRTPTNTAKYLPIEAGEFSHPPILPKMSLEVN